MVVKKNGYRLCQIYLFLVCSIISLVIQALNTNEGYRFMFFLPFFFGLNLALFCNWLKCFYQSYVIKLILLTMFIRYIIMPLCIVFSENYGGVGYNPQNNILEFSIFLMIYEMLFVFFIINFYLKNKLYKLSNKNKTSINYFKKNIIFSIIILIGIGLLIIFPGYLSKYKFILSLDQGFGEIEKLSNSFDGAIQLFIDYSKICLIIIFINKFKHLYDNSGKKIYLYLSYIIVLPTILFITGTSRLSIVLSALTYLILFINIFPEYKRRTIYIFCSLLITTVVISTTYKIFGTGINEISHEDSNLSWLAVSLQQYFAGPRNVALAIDANEKLINLDRYIIFINDFFRNIPFLGKVISKGVTSTELFNLNIYNKEGINDQIIPLIGQSLIYFGYILSPILSCIFYILAIKLERLMNIDNRIEFKYIYISLFIWFSLSNMTNMQFLVPSVFASFIPMYIIFCLNRKLKF